MLNSNKKTNGQRKLIPHFIDRYRYQIAKYLFWFHLISCIRIELMETPKSCRLTRCHVVMVGIRHTHFHNNIQYQVANDC